MKHVTTVLGVAAAALALGSAASTSASAAPPSARVYIIQGVPGVNAEVSVDGAVVAKALPGGKVLGPLSLKPGSHAVTARGGGKALAAATIRTTAGGSQDVVMHLPTDPTGPPVVTVYANDLSGIPRGKARLTVAHTAAVGPADIVVNGNVLFSNVANGEELSVVVPAATYSVKIVPTGASTPVVLGPLALPVKAGALNRVFAFGNPASTTMNVAVQVIVMAPTGTEKPSRIDSGTGGPGRRASLGGLWGLPDVTG